MLSKVSKQLLGKTLVTEQEPRQSASAQNPADLRPRTDASAVRTSLVGPHVVTCLVISSGL